jgi:hypothetical protein
MPSHSTGHGFLAAPVTVHGVLAGAYRGHNWRGVDVRVFLTHASADGGETALCGRVKAGSLCDQQVKGAPTCPVCARKVGL